MEGRALNYLYTYTYKVYIIVKINKKLKNKIILKYNKDLIQAKILETLTKNKLINKDAIILPFKQGQNNFIQYINNLLA